MPGADQARKAFQQACRENNPQATRHHLLAWARATWQENPPIGLKSIAARLGEQHIEHLLQQLDRACYTHCEWQGESLLTSLQSLPVQPKSAVRPLPKLGGLYP